jgi:hypothetical protein
MSYQQPLAQREEIGMSNNSETVRTFARIIREDYMNQPIAIWCARYTYRGIVKEVGEDFVTLSNPWAVEATGEAAGAVPTREDPIPSDLTISLGSVEQFCQPGWVAHQLEI